MQKIELKYSDHNKKRTKQILTGTLLAFSDIALKTYAGVDLQRVKRYYKSSVEQISTISEQLKKAIGNDGRLIVFIDDLDRCMIDNVLSMLEAIKLFLTVDGVIFILALDMSKIERAWELRYHGYPSASQESKDHIEKIFQLKLSLPPKTIDDIKSYIKEMTTSLPTSTQTLLIHGCPRNPRKLKRIINLIRFLSSSIDESVFQKYFPCIVIWGICTTVYPELSKIIKENTYSFVQMAVIAFHIQDIGTLETRISDFKEALVKKSTVIINKTMDREGLTMNYANLLPSTVRGLEFMIMYPISFELMKHIALEYGIYVKNEIQRNLEDALDKGYKGMGDTMSEIIHKTGLIS